MFWIVFVDESCKVCLIFRYTGWNHKWEKDTLKFRLVKWFNSSLLKSYLPKKESSFPTIFFQGRTVKLRGCIICFTSGNSFLECPAWILIVETWDESHKKLTCFACSLGIEFKQGHQHVRQKIHLGWIYILIRIYFDFTFASTLSLPQSMIIAPIISFLPKEAQDHFPRLIFQWSAGIFDSPKCHWCHQGINVPPLPAYSAWPPFDEPDAARRALVVARNAAVGHQIGGVATGPANCVITLADALVLINDIQLDVRMLVLNEVSITRCLQLIMSSPSFYPATIAW